MRCIFCKNDSSASRSCEHVIPESLGNSKTVLPPGIVCDKCNNYFSREVERPFLEAPALMALRFHQAIPSKRGRVPAIDAILAPGFPARVQRYLEGPFVGSVFLDPAGAKHILNSSKSLLSFPARGSDPPDGVVVSRFLAKVAIEVLAHRLRAYDGGLEYLVEETQFDPIRRHAREGQPRHWPYHARRIYDADRDIVDDDGAIVQTVYEFDVLATRRSEYYLILALFGLELTINIGGADIRGYFEWLEEHRGASPLYTPKEFPMGPPPARGGG